jgi:hypothetical protein
MSGDTSDAIVVPIQSDFAADAIGAVEQFLIELLAQHYHGRAPIVVRRVPAATVKKRHFEHRKEVAVYRIAVRGDRQAVVATR